MAARHLAGDFSEEYEDDYQSAYATAAQGKHLRKPMVMYVPTIPEDYVITSVHADVQADEKARSHVEEIYRELSVSHSSEIVQGQAQSQGMIVKSSRVSADLLPGFGPPQSQLAEFVPDIESVPGDWNQTTSEGVFARHQSASATLVLDQQSLHGLRRRISSRDHSQVGVAIEPRRPSSFGYYAPETIVPAKATKDVSHQRKGLIATIAEFFGRLFHRDS